jgi:hypothetical protein
MNAKVIEFEELEQPEEAINEITVDPETVVNAKSNCRPTKFLENTKPV